jgi:5-enolpyruvylshikimate-3-phosphate synthase
LTASTPTTIDRADCIETSFPNFEQKLTELIGGK